MKTRQVFVSRTMDMAIFPTDRSFAQAALDAIGRAEMVAVDMRYFAATDRWPADYCRARVRSCEIYVAIIGFRYGSVVPGKAVSYTEMEFLEATYACKPRLVFLLEESARSAEISDSDPAPVNAFRQRLSDSGIMVRYFTSGLSLELEVFHALSQLARKRHARAPGSARSLQPGPAPATKVPGWSPPPAVQHGHRSPPDTHCNYPSSADVRQFL